MPIVKMDRLTLVGLAQDREKIVEALMRLGAVHIDPDDNREKHDGTGLACTVPDSLSFAGISLPFDDMPILLSRLEKAIAECLKLRPVKKALFSSKRLVTASWFQSASERLPGIMESLDHFDAAQSRIGEIDGQILRLRSTEAMIAPWEPLHVDLSHKRSLKTRSFLGNFKTSADLDKLDEALKDEAPESITEVLSEDSDSLHVHIITLLSRESLVLANLRRLNFMFLPVQDEPATPSELLKRIRSDISRLEEERAFEISRRVEIAGGIADFEFLYDFLKMQFDKHLVYSQLASTQRTFYLEGWIPSKLTAPVEKSLSERFTIASGSRPALPGEKFPILLSNNRLIRPYETVVEMFNPPNSNEVDPSPVIAPFYLTFFGMMMGDVGYGLIMAALCAIPLFKFKVKGRSRRTYMLFFQCGLSSIFWGVMFGGYFGDLISAVTGGRFAIPPLLFDPVKNAMTMMLLSAVLGVIHIFTGMGVKAYIMIRSGDWKSAALDVFPWYLIILGLLLTLAGIGRPFTGYMAIAGAAVIVLFSARTSKNPLSRIGQGLYTLYGVTSYIGDILSYTRILAMVLAGSVVAMVFNKIGLVLPLGVFKYPAFVIVALVGHIVNFALSALSAYIHTSRLHFVEFFGKFYEGGGRLWAPKKLTSKYIDIE